MELEDFDKFVGIDVEAFKESPYLSFWYTNKDLIETITSDANMTDIVKLKTLSKLVYILAENSGEFAKRVSVEDFRGLISMFDAALDAIPDTDDNKEQKSVIDEKMAKEVVTAVAGFYNVDKSEIRGDN